MRIALIFLVLFTSLLMLRLLKDFDRENLENLFSNPFAKREIVVPLAQKDPLRELEGLLREQKITITQGPIASDSAMLVRLGMGDTLVIFSERRDLKLQVSSLQIILNKLTIEGRKVRKIDLRFDTPLVVY